MWQCHKMKMCILWTFLLSFLYLFNVALVNAESAKQIIDGIDTETKMIRFSKSKNITVILGDSQMSDKIAVQVLMTDPNLLSIISSSGKSMFVDKYGYIKRYSTSMIPELLCDKKSLHNYYVIPSLIGNSDVKMEITAAYFLNRVLTFSDGVKFLFTIDYSAVSGGKQCTVDQKKQIINFVTSATKLIKTLDKYLNSIALVITNVNKKFDVEDVTILKDVADAFKSIENEVKSNPEKVKFIKILVQFNGKVFEKMAVHRQAYPIASPNDAKQWLSKESETISFVTHITTEFTKVGNADFIYSISDKANKLVPELIKEVDKYLKTELPKTTKDTKTLFTWIESKTRDMSVLYSKAEWAYSHTSTINSNDPTSFFKQLSEVMETLEINMDIDAFKKTLHHVKLEQFLNNLIGRSSTFKFADFLESSIQYLKQSMLWYKLMLNLYEKLSSHQVQEDIDKLKNVQIKLKNEITISEDRTKNIKDTSLKQFLKSVGITIDQELENADANSYKLNVLKTILIETMDGPEVLCSSDKLTVKGFVVKLSDFTNSTCVHSVKFFEIFALYKLIVDTNFLNTFDESREQSQISVVAPTWEIIGQKKIVLSAGPQQARYKTAADGTVVNPTIPGLPGKPGMSGGRMLCFVQNTINEKNLLIELNGGKGGVGQHGGKGFHGRDGVDPKEDCGNRDDCAEVWRSQDLSFDHTLEHINLNKIFHYTVIGSRGKQGAPGGDGGKGGLPGRGGLFKIVKPIGSPVDFRVIRDKGENGEPGKGGEGGDASRDGIILKARFEDSIFSSGKFIYEGRIVRPIPLPKPGRDGRNIEDIEWPKLVNLTDPSFVVNNYKSFFRDQYANSIRQLELSSFFDEVIENMMTHDLYDIFGFINEFDSMEKQYLKLRKDFDFVPHIKSLLHRTKMYRKNIHGKNDNTTALHILQVALYSKLVHIKFYENRVSVTDLLGYMKFINKNIQKLKEIEHAIDWSDYQKTYKTGLDNKIKMALEIVDTQIKPEIDKIIHGLGANIGKLIEQIIQMQDAEADELIKLLKRRHELQKQMTNHLITNSLGMLSTVVGFLGPIGAAASVAITVGTGIYNSIVDDSVYYRLRSTSEEENTLQSVKEKMEDAVKAIRESLSDKHHLLLENINKIENKFKDKKYGAKILEKCKDLKRKVEADLNGDKIPIPSAADAMSQELENTINESKPEPGIDWAKHIKWAGNLLTLAQMGVDMYKQYAKDEKAIEVASENIKDSKGRMKQWEDLQNKIYTTIIPLTIQLKVLIKNINDGLNDKTHVELDVTKWKVTETIKEFQRTFAEVSDQTEIQSEISSKFDRLDEVMSVLINIFDRIDSYKDNAEFAQYIALMLSNGRPQIIDPKLNQAILTLQKTIHRNLILSQYSVGINALKQHYFPFAQFFLNSFDIEEKSKPTEVESLLNEAIQSTKDLITKISSSKLTVGKYQKDIFSNIDFKASTSEQGGVAVPFHQWKYEDISDEMEQFFNGEEITLRANIDKEFHKNKIALKFNIIEFSITSANAELHNELQSLLQQSGKSIRMAMIGNCYYRCGERTYYISVDANIVFEYSLEKNPKTGLPARTNDVYDKIMKSAYFLSPFTMWTIQMKDDTLNPKKIDDFKRFLNSDLKIELTGRGQYFVNGALAPEVCTDDLAKFYREVSNVHKPSYVKKLIMKSSLFLHDIPPSRNSSLQNTHCHQDLEQLS